MGILDEPDDIAVIYLNDMLLFENDSDKLQEAAVEVIRKLTTAGFMMNIKKSEFLNTEV